MNDQEIINNAPEGATHTETSASTRIYYLKKDANGMGYSAYLTKGWRTTMTLSGFIRSLADIKRIVELETCLINMRELLSGQKDKDCLGTGYPANENDCAPWPIVDEAINEITQALKEPKS